MAIIFEIFKFVFGIMAMILVQFPSISSASEAELIDQFEEVTQDLYDSLTFERDFPLSDDWRVLRKLDHGTSDRGELKILTHDGGEYLDREGYRTTIRAVTLRMPNMRTTPDLITMVEEFTITETSYGKEKHSTGISKWKNYGILQFREDTAKETLGWLSWTRPDVHKAVMELYNDDHDLLWNITYNVPFSIAMCVQYTWRRVPNFQEYIYDSTIRAELYKSEYNSRKGLATVNKYLERVSYFNEHLAHKL